MPDRDASLEFALQDQKVSVRLFRSIANDPEALNFKTLEIDHAFLPALRNVSDVIRYGTILREKLSDHPAIRSELEQFFKLGPPLQTRLRFLFGAGQGAEIFRWEALCDAINSFLALNGACTMTRVPLSGAIERSALRPLVGPIRLAGFLSPAGISAQGEFAAISEAVRTARASGLELEATLFVSEEDLLDQTPEAVTVLPIPENALGIEAALKACNPHVLHFFCHGRFSELGEHMLELASINDRAQEPPVGNIFLSIQRLRLLLVDLGTVWITVLNSCSGTKVVPRLNSMASILVRDGAAPATVGMAEEITDVDATLFATVFYKEVFALWLKALAPEVVGSAGVLIDFAPAVASARKALHTKYETDTADAFGRWCLPILYQRNEPLRVVRLDDPTMLDRIEAVTTALQILPSSTPPAVRAQFRDTLKVPPAVPETLWPDLFGNLA